MEFKTDNQRTILLELKQRDGTPIPMNASIMNEQGEFIASVLQGGRSLVRGITDHGQLVVKWTESAGEEQQCQAAYILPSESKKQNAQGRAFDIISLVCE